MAEKRHERELALGLEQPERMRRCERWLRSPFLQEEADRSSCRLARHGCKVYSGDLCEHHFESKSIQSLDNVVKACSTSSSECVRCGCSGAFDEYGDRVCWCDSCEGDGCQPAVLVKASSPPAVLVKASSPSAGESLRCWEQVLVGMLRAHGTSPGEARSRKHRQTRKLHASAAQIQHWARLHGASAGLLVQSVDQQRALLMREAPPQELTLSSQHVHMERVEQNRWGRLIRSRWNRMLLSLCAVHHRKTRAEALREVTAARTAVATPCALDRLPSEPFALSMENEAVSAVLAAELGLDVATYLMLRQLEQREILPEDYDLLGRLDDTLKPRTLNLDDLAQFETRIYAAQSSPSMEALEASWSDFGIDYWRLPFPASVPSEEKRHHEVHCYGASFWRLPISSIEDDCSSTYASHEDCDVCGVCLVAFNGGDELRVLPCGHHFHRECIDHWLLNCSTACPVDKRDLAGTD